MRPLTRLGCALAVVGLLQTGLIAQAPALDDVLAKVASYHREYMERMSGVSLVEETRLMNVTGGVVRSTVRISSDVVFVALDGQVQALRDPFAIDTRPLRPREPRIMRLLGAPAQPTAADWSQAAGFPQTNAVYFLLDIVVRPTSRPARCSLCRRCISRGCAIAWTAARRSTVWKRWACALTNRRGETSDICSGRGGTPGPTVASGSSPPPGPST